jgi:hypothetical protein
MIIATKIGYRTRQDLYVELYLRAAACLIGTRGILLFDMHDVAVYHHTVFVVAQTLVVIVGYVEEEREMTVLIRNKLLIKCLSLAGRIDADYKLQSYWVYCSINLAGIITLMYTLVIKVLYSHAVLLQDILGVVEEVLHHDNGLEFIGI